MTCPKCKSDLIVEVGQQKHCNSCGNDYDFVKNPVRKVERFQSSGFKPHEPLKP